MMTKYGATQDEISKGAEGSDDQVKLATKRKIPSTAEEAIADYIRRAEDERRSAR